ncbi:MAG: primosomal protein N' [Candidatus Thiodiazotropha sp. (ex Myrtea sp. 'scaly one' KF741663)]|nr:primosomal protein N' [Candidatus Thiodiazotropha sp. (ex Myrtea sp. 'scaly one' KF741663)]
MVSEPILRIALSGPLRTLFDYLMPVGMSQLPIIGTRFQVPFGRGGRTGLLIGISDSSELPRERLKRATRQLDDGPLLNEKEMRLLQWAADYYQHPLGDVIFQALPVNLRKTRAISLARPEAWRLSATGRQADIAKLSRAPKQLAVMQTLSVHTDGLLKAELIASSGASDSVLRSLNARGWIERCHLVPSNQSDDNEQHRHPLNPAQQAAVDQVSARLNEFIPFLLNGVTGSGKTEVYLCLIEAVLAQGRQVLVLVPEIGLTPQLMDRFKQRLGHQVALLHSALADGEREAVWHDLRLGNKQVLLGTRSAVFTPMPDLGLVVVDEEHDLSYKQQEGFRYSARDLALVRGQQAGCPVLLGSATPSLESLRNAEEGRYQQLDLPNRVADASLPDMHLIDIRSVPLDGGLSPAMINEIRTALSNKEQVMLFLNRRGYAPMLTCHACGWLTDCPRCDARMTHHRKQNMLWCHHCGHQRRVPQQCPECGSPDLRTIGQGTEQIEERLGNLFPEAPLARIDKDSTSRKGALEKLLEGIHSGAYPLLLGTQMLAKGHHFPDVTLVGILDVDQGLFGADYRASERMAQLILQVSGRAGRAARPGRVLIQTRHPEHPLMQILTRQGYSAFSKEALAERRLALLPPFSHQVLIRAESTKASDPIEFLHRAAAVGKSLNGADQIELWGPVPAPMERRAGRIRAHLLVQSSQRKPLHQWLAQWVPELITLPEARKVRWSIDVDPMEML